MGTRTLRLLGAVLVVSVLGAAACGSASALAVPDGPRLAFTALSELKKSAFTVNTVGVESPKPVVVVRGSRSGVVPRPLDGVAWSADGSRLAFSGSRGSRRGIYTVRADGTGLRFLAGTTEGSNPVFSPDGSKLAFEREHLGKELFLGTTPWVVDANGGRPRRLADWHSEIQYVPASFSPDGSTLAVTKEKLGTGEPRALLLSVEGDGVGVLARQASEPVFSPDGSQIAFVQHSFSREAKVKITHKDLYVMSADGSATSALTQTPWMAESHPSWDPSGQRLAFNSYRISKDPIEALFDELLPFGDSIAQVNADGTCRKKILTQRVALFGAAWRPGPGREAGRILC